jgi:HlyD family secretion protein
MPVEAYIRSDDRTVMSFFVKPLQDQIVKAFRER